MAVPFPYIVTIWQQCEALNRAKYELDVGGFGAATLEDARKKAAEDGHRWTGGKPWRAEVRLACAACNVSGVKPGCKKKPCADCKGSGAVPVPAAA